jgi:hypothetical protein
MSSETDEPAMDLFDRIEEDDAKDEAARILAMDDTALDEDLRAGGLDPAAVRAKGRALGEQLEKAASRARRVKLAKGAAIVAAVVAGAVTALLLTRKPAERTLPPLPGFVGGNEGPNVSAPRPTPDTLRLRASEACAAQDWKRCLQLLDDAKDGDPEGDRAPEVRALRDRAARGMGTP